MCVGLCFVLCVCYLFVCFFFFKQKTAYEMRISDWSSDVCSSDLWTWTRPLNSHQVSGREADIYVKIQEAPMQSLNILIAGAGLGGLAEIGRASCRERVCQYV